jgi:hypothetical protein
MEYAHITHNGQSIHQENVRDWNQVERRTIWIEKPSRSRKAFKKQDFKGMKQAYIQAKAAYQACMIKHSSNEDSDSDSKDENSNKSYTSYSSEGSNES